jgi:hypothetical protein
VGVSHFIRSTFSIEPLVDAPANGNPDVERIAQFQPQECDIEILQGGPARRPGPVSFVRPQVVEVEQDAAIAPLYDVRDEVAIGQFLRYRP